MTSVKWGDILTVERGIIVHGCNARGVMGSGLARQVKARWPRCFEEYRAHVLLQACGGRPCLGDVVPYVVTDELIIASAITQETYGREPGKVYVNYAAVKTCFSAVALAAKELQLPVHYPMIGAGLGGGDWSLIERQIDAALEPYTEVERTLWVYYRNSI